MPDNIQKRPDLLIVSDTAVYIDEKGTYLAFEPVAREIEHFAFLFNSITWIAEKYTYNPKIKNVKKIDGIPIKYILTPAIGGKGLFNRIKILREYLRLSVLILLNIIKADVIHTRGPSHAAIIAAFYSFFFRKKIFWHKYAGNWNGDRDPLSYRINKYLLKKAKKTIVTINGHWPSQPEHCISFENPCITKDERIEGEKALKSKNYNGILDFVFVGSLTESKGVGRIIEAFRQLKNESRVGILHFVGDGPERVKYEKVASESGLNCRFYGFLPREEVNKVLALSHVLLLPSASEGFPKVIAEGANYGCIPVVSAVSSIPQYIKNKFNGFVMSSLDTEGLVKSIRELLFTDREVLEKIAHNAYNMGEKFTYIYYIERIQEKILNDN